MAKDKKSIVEEFVEFISRGNVVDLAVGVIIGGAFTSVVNSLVSSIIQPLISAIGGNPEVKGLSVVLNGQTIDFTQTGVIAKTADGNYTLTIEGTDTVYTKARQ